MTKWAEMAGWILKNSEIQKYSNIFDLVNIWAVLVTSYKVQCCNPDWDNRKIIGVYLGNQRRDVNLPSLGDMEF